MSKDQIIRKAGFVIYDRRKDRPARWRFPSSDLFFDDNEALLEAKKILARAKKE